jgi:hypothetical protein
MEYEDWDRWRFLVIKNVLVVLTWRPVAQILSEGGSQAWTLQPKNARRCSYLVCTRNRYAENSAQDVPHGSAFLVGKISGIEHCPNDPADREESPRYLVRISEYALIEQSDVWPGNRNPFWYVNDLSALNIDVDSLNWLPMLEKKAN